MKPCLRLSRCAATAALVLAAGAASVAPAAAQFGYQQVNLVTDDQQNLINDGYAPAAHVDPNLVNPWGISFSAGSPFWVSDNGTGLSTLYDGSRAPCRAWSSRSRRPTGSPAGTTAAPDRPGLQRHLQFRRRGVPVRDRGRDHLGLERGDQRRAEGGQLRVGRRLQGAGDLRHLVVCDQLQQRRD